MITDGEWIAVETDDPMLAKPKPHQKVIFVGKVRTAQMPHVGEDGELNHGRPDSMEKLCLLTKEGWPLPIPKKFHRTCEQTCIEALRMRGELKESDA